MARIAAELIGGELSTRLIYVRLLYHRELPSVHLTDRFEARFSPNFTWQLIRGSAAKL
jgi:hypothetical protein